MEIDEITEITFDELLKKQKEKEKKQWRIHNRQRIINKRKKIMKQRTNNENNLYVKEPSRMSKDNLACSCWMCRWEKKNKIEKPKYQQYIYDED